MISVSEGVREIVHRRIARLSPTTAQAIDAASVLSGNVPMRLLELITDADEVDSLPDAVDEAVRAGILVAAPSGAGFVFSHALIRRAIYEQLGTAGEPVCTAWSVKPWRSSARTRVNWVNSRIISGCRGRGRCGEGG